MAHRVAPSAETDLDDIWYYAAKESGSIEMANRLIDSITDRFFLLASFPYMGRSRDEDFGVRSRSFGVGEYVIVYSVEGDDVLILRVAHGRREIEALFPR
ncbi:MAG TPA: type II toxin-antitoxin system RelE/ParE family toxin [Bryobacteraceae bacterium]|nr:type II toxin-antitoxin system RelE/ParE family toxin [Bryobacteraceae bacterium]